MIGAVRNSRPAAPVPPPPPASEPFPAPLTGARARPAAAVSGSASRQTPDRSPSQAAPLRTIFRQVEQQREQLDQAIRAAAGGRTFSPAELIGMQARVYAYAETLEVISQLVDRSVSAVKTTLNTQV